MSLHFAMATVQSRMRVAAPDKLVLDYTRSMMAFLLFKPEPDHIVMVGLGGGSLAKYCHAKLPHTRFTALEISPEVIAMRELFSIPPDDERLQVVCTDGAVWIRDNPAGCDVLMLDGFDAQGLPSPRIDRPRVPLVPASRLRAPDHRHRLWLAYRLAQSLQPLVSKNLSVFLIVTTIWPDVLPLAMMSENPPLPLRRA